MYCGNGNIYRYEKPGPEHATHRNLCKHIGIWKLMTAMTKPIGAQNARHETHLSQWWPI